MAVHVRHRPNKAEKGVPGRGNGLASKKWVSLSHSFSGGLNCPPPSRPFVRWPPALRAEGLLPLVCPALSLPPTRSRRRKSCKKPKGLGKGAPEGEAGGLWPSYLAAAENIGQGHPDVEVLQDLQGLVPDLLRAADRETPAFPYLGPQLWENKGGPGWEGGFPEAWRSQCHGEELVKERNCRAAWTLLAGMQPDRKRGRDNPQLPHRENPGATGEKSTVTFHRRGRGVGAALCQALLGDGGAQEPTVLSPLCTLTE